MAPPARVAGLTARRRRRLIVLGLFRGAATAVVLVALYYVLPFDRMSDAYVILLLAVGVGLFVGTVAWQVRAIIRSRYPGIRAYQALAVVTSLFLLLFASIYVALSLDDPETFTEQLTKSDALYFTITIFSTVGFGDISAQETTARLVVAVQMLLDLVVLGLGAKVILGAVQKARTSDEPEEIES